MISISNIFKINQKMTDDVWIICFVVDELKNLLMYLSTWGIDD